ncbi:helix-turn-helix domain-containing protein [Flavobacterium sp. HBTb2-11-1]|uniref:helix-turn-helix domain-containing protein n=1 Tax=Flavobacterium sp. HBTb2-11-1 TaxID=2692212 RepID=UPI0013683119|nr:helix-turn-helix domain-containing protein [Flavobacterium sp. HBTb2-11-1]MXO03494.1 hypothetical protein [Flavobacterium sp. HBTb2-11-1]
MAIKEFLPEGTNAAHLLMDLLSLGKESVYRRMRGEIEFTLDEMIKITNRFGISIDDIIASGKITSKWAILNLDTLVTYENYTEQYCERLKEYLAIFQKMQSAKRANISTASNAIPISFLFLYKKLSQFRHYKWHYLKRGAKPNFAFSSMVLPDEIIKIEKHFAEESNKVPMKTIVIDEDIFLCIIRDIRFFYSQQLITKMEMLELKQELLELVSLIELVVETGSFYAGNSMMIYLSKINIDGIYHNIEYDNEELCFQGTFYMDLICFNNVKFFKKQKEWIDLLKRFSILLTQSGDRQQLEFFENQRLLINSLE